MAKRPTRAEALRSAVDQTFSAAAGQAQTTRDRAQELVDELAATAGRLRGALDERLPPTGEDVRGLDTRLGKLEARVAKLERAIVKKDGAGK
jgi:polyhydroxyalkanoate synthesis regulator phasin